MKNLNANPKIFYKTMAKFYDLIDVIYLKNYNRSPRKVALEAINNGDSVLDLCAGAATNALKIAKENPKSKVTGIDLSKNMLEIAIKKANAANIPNIELREMDATELQFADKSFDKILLSLGLHETEDDLAEKIVSEAKRTLKDDGEIIVTEWERSKNRLCKILFFPIEILEPKPYKAFVKKDLKTYFDKLGLKTKSEKHCDYSKVLI